MSRHKIILFPIPEEGAKIVGVFRVKNHNFMPKNHIFSNFSAACVPLDPPLIWIRYSLQASIASTHRYVHVQIVVLGAFLHHS